jgi:phage terminase Nu1 subunit (DNA packaging protein)
VSGRDAKKADESVTITEAARRLGLSQQALSKWAQKVPRSVVEETEDGKRFLWPAFPKWYLKRIRHSSAEQRARLKRSRAEARMAELELAKIEGRMVDAELVEATWAQVAERMAARLKAVPGRYATRTVGLDSLPESQAVWDEAIRDVMGELAGTGGAGS